jgi:glycerol-3-phosphate dehydrogenase (NAD(P)+)
MKKQGRKAEEVKREIAVVGGGSYGTALAKVLTENGHNLRLYVYESDTCLLIEKTGINARWLPGFQLNMARITVTRDAAAAVKGARIVFLAVPAQHMEQVLHSLKGGLSSEAIVVVTSKGMIKHETMAGLAERILELTSSRVCGVYGITFARAIASEKSDAGLLSSMCIASVDESVARTVAALFTSTTAQKFRIYVGTDIRGAEFGGAMKNVYAIAMGLLDGWLEARRAQTAERIAINATRYSLLNLCVLEFMTFGMAYGGRPDTLLGPSGVGDITACVSETSRNYRYGRWHAKLELEGGTEAGPDLFEGYETLRAAVQFAMAHPSLDLPILNATYDVLFNRKRLEDVYPELLSRISGIVGAVADWGMFKSTRILSNGGPGRFFGVKRNPSCK